MGGFGRWRWRGDPVLGHCSDLAENAATTVSIDTGASVSSSSRSGRSSGTTNELSDVTVLYFIATMQVIEKV